MRHSTRVLEGTSKHSVIKISNILNVLFKKIKINAKKIHNEQHINTLNKGEIQRGLYLQRMVDGVPRVLSSDISAMIPGLPGTNL